MDKTMKILAAFSDWNHTEDRRKLNTYGGIGYYRIIKPMQSIKGHEIDIVGKEFLHFGDTLEEQCDNIFKKYDVLWTNYFADDQLGSALLYHADKYKKKLIVDVDDNYLDVPKTNQLYDRFKPGKRERAMLSTILSLASAITVSTEPLKERIHSHIKAVHGIDKPIYVIPNMNDIKDWDFIPAPKHKDKIVIGYTGSNSHQDDMKMMMPALKEVMERHENVYFETIGVVAKDKIKDYFGVEPGKWMDRCAILPATSTFKDYPRYLSDQKWDIGIAPLVDTSFTACKSHIKWMEYAMYKIPTIASRVYPYYMDINDIKTITDNETGLLCRPKEWVNALERLIESKEERERIGNNAYNHVKEHWQYPGIIPERVDRMLAE